MKKNIYNLVKGSVAFSMLLLASCLLTLTSCEKDLEKFNQEDSWVNWFFNYEEDNYIFNEETPKTSYSFAYAGSGVQTDTLWYYVQTTGFVSDRDRQIELVQVQDETAGVVNAQPGVHYVPFDDASIKEYYVAPAGTPKFLIPIVLKRDASLKQTDVMLKVTFRENNEFKVGYNDFAVRYITISDRLTAPSLWDSTSGVVQYYFGKYGPVKHQFLIDMTGEKWDDEYIRELTNGDSGYISYLAQLMARKLAALNAERTARGEDPLTEDDGTVVSIP